MENPNVIEPRNGELWTEDEDEQLSDYWRLGFTARAIATMLLRPLTGVNSRIGWLQERNRLNRRRGGKRGK